jgi:hypothetical protein
MTIKTPDVLFTHGLCCLDHRGLRSCRDNLAAHDVAHFFVTFGFLIGRIEHAREFNDIFFSVPAYRSSPWENWVREIKGFGTISLR